MNRSARSLLAAQTLEIVERGYYVNNAGDRVEIGDEVRSAVKGTQLCTPEDLLALIGRPARQGAYSTVFEVRNCTTLAAARKLVVDRGLGRVLALNFASAKNPGGGFLSGSQAQEESLARASALYETLLTASEYYRRNRNCGTPLYTDLMILSPDVPVFRDDTGALLDGPYALAFLSAPAVNAQAVRKNSPQDVGQIKTTMSQRLRMILALAADQDYRHLILGAWGCGAFGNRPADVARDFARELIEPGEFSHSFETVVFAVLDHSRQENVIAPFRSRFALA